MISIGLLLKGEPYGLVHFGRAAPRSGAHRARHYVLRPDRNDVAAYYCGVATRDHCSCRVEASGSALSGPHQSAALPKSGDRLFSRNQYHAICISRSENDARGIDGHVGARDGRFTRWTDAAGALCPRISCVLFGRSVPIVVTGPHHVKHKAAVARPRLLRNSSFV